MAFEITGCEIARCSAAFAMLPCSATACRIRRSLNLSRRTWWSDRCISMISKKLQLRSQLRLVSYSILGMVAIEIVDPRGYEGDPAQKEASYAGTGRADAACCRASSPFRQIHYPFPSTALQGLIRLRQSDFWSALRQVPRRMFWRGFLPTH